VEARSGVSEPLFTGTQGTEVLSSLGDNIGTQFHDNSTGILAADGHIEVNFRVRPERRKKLKRKPSEYNGNAIKENSMMKTTDPMPSRNPHQRELDLPLPLMDFSYFLDNMIPTWFHGFHS